MAMGGYTVNWAGAALLICILLLPVSCTNEEKLSPKADAFQQETLGILEKFRTDTADMVITKDTAGLDEYLADYFDKATQAGEPPAYGMAAMDDEIRLLAGRFPLSKDEPKGQSIGSGHDYSRYGHFDRVVGKQEIGSCVLYHPDATMYTVCMPVNQGRKVVGLVCVGWPEEVLTKHVGLTKEDFLALDFN